MEREIRVVAYGGSLDSTAMLIGLHLQKTPVDLILFVDTGAEQPHTYAYLPVMNQWLTSHGMPEITVSDNPVRSVSGNRYALRLF